MKIVYLLILSFLIGGCINKSPHILKSYDLNIDVAKDANNRNRKVLLIKYPKSLGAISGSRIYYKKDNLTSYYLYSRWSSSLNSMIYKDILQAMQSSKYSSVIGYNSSAKADLALESEIIDFYHIVSDNNSYAQITISVNLIDLNSNKIIKSKIFRYKKDIAIANAESFVLSAKEALREFLEELKNSI